MSGSRSWSESVSGSRSWSESVSGSRSWSESVSVGDSAEARSVHLLGTKLHSGKSMGVKRRARTAVERVRTGDHTPAQTSIRAHSDSFSSCSSSIPAFPPPSLSPPLRLPPCLSPSQSFGRPQEATPGASLQKDILKARGGSTDPFPNHPGTMPTGK